MSLVVLIVLATVFYTLYDVFAARASGGIDPNASSFLFNGLGALIPLAIFFYLKSRSGNVVHTTKSGVVYSLLAGVAMVVIGKV